MSLKFVSWLIWTLNLEELCEAETRNQNRPWPKDPGQELSRVSPALEQSELSESLLFGLPHPCFSRTAIPGSMLRIWPSPSAAAGHNEAFVRPPACVPSLTPTASTPSSLL